MLHGARAASCTTLYTCTTHWEHVLRLALSVHAFLAECAVIVLHASLAASQIIPELFESAHHVWLVIQRMSSIWCLSAQHCRESEMDTLGLFENQAATMVQFMCQHDTHAIAQFRKEYMDTHHDPGLQSQGKAGLER